MASVYIHIPFCSTICTYCDFTKMYYNNDWANKYLQALEKEIKTEYKNDLIKTIYIGGGTPSCLNQEQLKYLISIISIFRIDKNAEVTFECNIESIDEEKIDIIKNKVNRISVGIETFNQKHLNFLNRKYDIKEVVNKLNMIKRKGIDNINIDLIYAIPNQTKNELEEDLKKILDLNIPHISTYSLIIEPHTILDINKTKYIDETLDYEMYQIINKTLSNNEYINYEFSNYSKKGYESKHNLVYWNNEEYYGFGLGASGYIDYVRYENTKSLNNYLSGNYIKESHKLDETERMQNEMILGLRKLKGINKKEFKNKYKKEIEEVFDIKELLNSHKLIDKDGFIYINKDYLYISNEILINFI